MPNDNPTNLVQPEAALETNAVPTQTFTTPVNPTADPGFDSLHKKMDEMLRHVGANEEPLTNNFASQPAAAPNSTLFGRNLGKMLVVSMAVVTGVIIVGGIGVLFGTHNSSQLKPTDSKSLLSGISSNLPLDPLQAADNASVLQINRDTLISGGKSLTARGDVLIQSTVNSADSFKIQNSDGSNILVADTKNNQINIGNKPPGNVSLNVEGDITTNGSLVSTAGYSLTSEGLTIGNLLVCTARGCISSNSPAPTPTSPTIDVANLDYLNLAQTFTGAKALKLDSTTAFQVQNAAGSSNSFVVDSTNGVVGIGMAPINGLGALQVAGAVNASNGFETSGVAGSNFSCPAAQVLQQAVISGGLVTGGSCVAIAGGTTPSLQQVYDSSFPASVVLSNASGVLSVQDAASPLGSNLFEVASNGGGTKYFAVNSLGVSVTGNVSITGQYQISGTQISSANLSNDGNLAKLNANQTFSGNNTFSSASNSFTGNGAGLTSLNASNISSGTLNDARLSANVALLNGAQTFTANNTFKAGVNSTTAFQIQNAAGSSNLLIADTVNNRVGIGKAPTLGVLDVNGAIYQAGNQVCDTSGNCVGTGAAGAGIGGSGSTNSIPVFTGVGSIGNSILTQAAGVVTAAGSLNVTGTYQVNGSQITSTNLSDGANLAKLNGNQTFSGNNTFSSASNSFTGNGAGLTSLNASNISSGTLNDARLSANVALLNGTGPQTFSGNNKFTGTVLNQNTSNSTTAFQIQNAAGTSNLFVADTTNSRVGIGKAPSLGTLDVNGTIFQSGNQVCDTSGNCAGSGAGIGGSGTAGKIALFTGSGFTIGDSILTQAAGTVTAAGNLNTTGVFQVSGSQISSANLSNDANIAKLNGNQTFSGNNTFSSASNSFTGNGAGLTSLNASNVSSGTLGDARLSGNVALLNANNTFTGNNSIHLNSTAFTVQDAVSPLGADLFAVTDNAGTTKYFSVSATGAKIGANDICTTAGNCAGVGGGVTTTGGTINKLAKFTAGSAIGDSIITDNGSTVTIGGTLAVNTISPTAAMTIGLTNKSLTLQGDGTTTLTATASGITNSIVFAAPSSTNKTITVPNATGTLAVSASGPLALDAAGNLTCPTCLTSGGGSGSAGVSSVNTLTGGLTLQGTANQISVSSGGTTITLSTPQDIATGSSPTFANVNVTGQFKVGGSQIASTNLSDSANLAKLNGTGPQTFTGNNKLTGTVLSQNASNSTNAFAIQNATGTSNLFIADTTNTRLAVAQTLASYTLDVGGDINTTGVYRVNGTALSSSNLSDTANVALLNANQTFSGNNTFSSASNSFTGSGAGLSSLNASNVSSGTLNDARLSANVALLNAHNTFQNASNAVNSFVIQNAAGTSNLFIADTTNTRLAVAQASANYTLDVGGDINTTGVYRVNGTAISSSNLSNDSDLAKLSGNQTFTGVNTLSNASNSFTGSGAGLTSLDAGNVSTGTLNDARLSANVALLNAHNNFKNTSNNTSSFQIQNAAGTSNLFIADTTNTRLAVAQASAAYTLDVGGDINTTTGYRVAGTAGSTVTCSSGNVVQNAVISGGIITGGTCVANGGGSTPTIATVYNGGANQADETATLASAKGGIIIQDNSTPIGASLFTVQNNGGSSKYLDVTSAGLSIAGNVDITGIYKVSGTQISSANLSNDSNLAKLSANQIFSGNNTFSGTVLSQNTSNSTTAFQIQNSAGTSNLFIANTTNSRIGIDKAPTQGALDVNGAIYQSGNQVCDTSGNCVGTGGGGGIGGGGTTGTIALFTGTGFTIGDSLLTQSGSTLTTGGNLTVSGSNTFTTGSGVVALNGNTTVASNKTFTANGDSLFKDATNTANALQVQDSSGNSILNVATNGTVVYGFESGVLAPFTSASGWTALNSNAHSGSWSAGTTTNTTTLTLTQSLTTASTLSFWAKANPTGCATPSTFKFDGTTQITFACNVNVPYTFYTFAVSSGAHTFTWNGGGGVPNYYVDDVTVTGPSLLINGGSVGVGTTNPTSYFDIQAPTTALSAFQIQGSSGSNIINVDASNNSLNLFQIQNPAGGNLFNADSINSNITVGQGNLLVTGLGIPAVPVITAGSNQGGTLLGDSTTYYYKVTSINSAGNETLASPEASIAGSSFTKLAVPTALTAAANASAGNVSCNNTGGQGCKYEVTFVTANGETTGGTASASVLNVVSKQIDLTAIPLGPTGTTQRKIYRSTNNSAYLLDQTINNNTATTATDNIAAPAGAIPGANTATTNLNNATVTFTPITGASSYHIYRGTAAGAESAYQTTASSPFTDTGAAGTAATTPTASSVERVGIGTASPTANLMVAGNVLFENAIDTTTAFQVQNSAGNPVLIADTSDRYIGINNSTPNAALDVVAVSAPFFNGFESSLLTPFASVGTSPVIISSIGAGAPHSGTFYAFGNISGLIPNMTITENFSSPGVVTYWLKSQTNSSIGTNRFHFDVDGVTCNNVIETFSAWPAWGQQTCNVTSGTHLLSWNVNNGTGGFAVDDITMTNTTGTTSAATFNSGNVGIGTYFPGATLDVSGTQHLQAGSGADSVNLFQIQNASASTLFNIDSTNLVNNLTNNNTNNLVTNGSFEAGTTGWAIDGASVTIAQDLTRSYIGSASLSVITPANANRGAKYALTTTTLASNTKYNLTLSARMGSGTSMSTFEIGRAEDGATETACLTAQSVNSSGWTNFSCTFTTGATSGTPYIYVKQTDATARTFYIDAVQLTQYSILSNASMEQALSASNWQAKGSPTTHAQDATQFVDGSNSLKLVTTATANQGTMQNITLIDNTNYRLTFFGLNTGAAFATMEAGYSSDGATDNTVCETAQTITTSWTSFTCRFVTPSSHSGTPYIYIKQTNAAVHTFYIDSVQLTAGNPVSSYKEGLISLNGIINSPTIFQNQTESSNAFQIQNAIGGALFNADTLNSNITVGQGNLLVTGLGIPGTPVVTAGSNQGGSLLGDSTINYYKITAINASGNETLASQEASIVGSNFTPLTAPTAATVGAPSAGGSVTLGTHSYKVTFVTANGETTGGTTSSVVNVTTGGTQTVPLTAIPLGPTGTTQRKIYRTVTGNGGSYLLDTTIANNTATTFNDTVADGSLGVAAPGSNTATTNTNNATITWTLINGAVSYRIYSGTASGGESEYQTAIGSPFTDTGANGISASPPSSSSVERVGIGTSTPTANLTVAGTAIFQNGVNTTSAFNVEDSSGASALNVDTSNRFVGINNVNPQATLDVLASSANYFNGFETGSLAPFVAVGSWSVVNSGAHTGSYSAISAGHGQDLNLVRTLSSAGTVSFWAFNHPASFCEPYLFKVDGVTAITSQVCTGYLYFSAAVPSGTHTLTWHSASNSFGSNLSLDDVTVTNTGTGTAAIFNGGGVGIGTAFPNATLEVDGTALFKSASGSDSANQFQIQSAGSLPIVDVSTISTTQNLVNNPSFESSTAGWRKYSGNESTFASSASNPQSGTQSLNVVSPATATNDGTKYTYYFKPNTTYNFSAYAMGTVSFAKFDIGANVNGSDVSCSVSGNNQTLNASLTRYSCNFTTGGTTTSSDYLFLRRNNGDSATARTMYFDAAQLEIGAGVTNFADQPYPNLVANSSLESGSNGWTTHNGGAGNSVAASNDFSLYGNSSLKLVTGTVANNGAQYNYNFNPSGRYTLSLWLRRDTSTTSTINIGQAENGTDNNCLTGQTVNTTWTQFTCTFTVGATVNDTTSNLYVKQTDTATDNIYIDGVTLTANGTGQNYIQPAASLQADPLYGNLSLNNSNIGEIQPWQSAATLPGARYGQGSVVVNGYLYVLGGDNSGVPQNPIYYAKLNADGSTGSWQTAANSMPVGLEHYTSVTANGYIYIMGGDNGVAVNGVYYAKVNSGDGNLGNWQSTTSLLDARDQHTSVVANGYVYVMGGYNAAGTPQADVEYAKLNADGTVGGWQRTTAFPNGEIVFHTSVYANGYIYLIGGSQNFAGIQSSTWYAKASADGSLSSWTQNTNVIPSVIGYHTSVVSNGYLYVVGGYNGTTDQSAVYFAKLNSDGSTGAWQTSANSLPEVLEQHSSVVINGYIYAIGGQATGGGSGPGRNTVYYTSTSRILVGGSLDLVGLSGGNLASAGDVNQGNVGGSLTAGNTIIVGSLLVAGQANFSQGVGIAGNLSVGGGFAVQNSSGSILLSANTANNAVSVGTNDSVAVTYASHANAPPGTGTTTGNIGLTVSGNNPVIIVNIGLNSTTDKVSSVSWSLGSGTAYEVKTVSSSTTTVSSWAIPAPVGGTGNVVVNFSPSVDYQVDAQVFNNVDQTTPAPIADAGSATGGNVSSLSVTPSNIGTGDAASAISANTVSGDSTGMSPNATYTDATSNVNVSSGNRLGPGALTGNFNTGAGMVTAMVAIHLKSSNGSTTTVQGGSIKLNPLGTGNTGVTVTPANNSTATFQVQNALGSSALSVDTTAINTLITNGNAEGASIANWASKQNATVTRDTTQAYSGTASIKTVLGGSPAANDGVKYTPSPVLAATTYTLSFYIKQTAGTAFGTNLAVGWNNGSDTNCTLSPTLTAQPVPTTGWARYSCSFTGSTGASDHIYWKQTDAPGSARTFYIDAVQLEAGSSATAYKETGLNFSGLIASSLQLQNTSDSNTAFVINNSSGSNLLTVDTLNSRTTVRSSTDNSLAFQIQNANGSANLLTADTSGLVITIAGNTTTFASLTITNAHVKSLQTTAPTIGTPTNCGTGSPSATVTAASTDSAGSFVINSGTSGTSCDTVFTFNKAYGSAPKSVLLTPMDAGSAAKNIYVSATSTTTFTVKFGVNPADNSPYSFYYWVVE